MSDESPDGALPTDDERLEALIHRADLDGLVELVDARTEQRDWDGLARARRLSRQAITAGRQLWPIATLAEYRLALLAPAPQAAAIVNDDDAGRFTIGPLTEVVAQHHRWAEPPVPCTDRSPRSRPTNGCCAATVDVTTSMAQRARPARRSPGSSRLHHCDVRRHRCQRRSAATPQRGDHARHRCGDTVNDSTIDGGDVDRRRAAVRAMGRHLRRDDHPRSSTARRPMPSPSCYPVTTCQPVTTCCSPRSPASRRLPGWHGAAPQVGQRPPSQCRSRTLRRAVDARRAARTDEWPLPLDGSVPTPNISSGTGGGPRWRPTGGPSASPSPTRTKASPGPGPSSTRIAPSAVEIAERRW